MAKMTYFSRESSTRESFISFQRSTLKKKNIDIEKNKQMIYIKWLKGKFVNVFVLRCRLHEFH